MFQLKKEIFKVKYIFMFFIFFSASLKFVNAADLFGVRSKMYSGICHSSEIPKGASLLNYTNKIIDECPSAHDVVDGYKPNGKLFRGVWFLALPKSDQIFDIDGSLAMSLGGGVATLSRSFEVGSIPLLSGDKGFYVEFEVTLSDNDKDHWPAVWLMPVQHNYRKDDSYPEDMPNYQRWLEIDVDEGGFSPGMHGTAICWQGVWPNYKKSQNRHPKVVTELDRTKSHVFGVGYDPKQEKFTWWLDDELQMEASVSCIQSVAKRQNFFIIMNAQSHSLNKPYVMLVTSIRAFGKP